MEKELHKPKPIYRTPENKADIIEFQCINCQWIGKEEDKKNQPGTILGSKELICPNCYHSEFYGITGYENPININQEPNKTIMVHGNAVSYSIKGENAIVISLTTKNGTATSTLEGITNPQQAIAKIGYKQAKFFYSQMKSFLE